MSDVNVPWLVGGILLAAIGIAAVVLIVLLVRKYRFLRSPDTPFPAKFAFWGSLVYTVFPIDALPDPIYLDDVGLLLGAFLYISTTLRKKRRPSTPSDGPRGAAE
ncbi:YkvA family protein [Actinokineospora sp. G85]|uniref:YkvA family protein n=1 Tax=Actinokineospora sp. G85 TaxID=3406626 RepID=UPI003C75024B